MEYRRIATSPDGSKTTVHAKPKVDVFRPFVYPFPLIVGVTWSVLRRRRARIRHGGQWIVTLHRTYRPENACVVSTGSKAEALAYVDAKVRALETPPR
jgi:hypothetical protein